jgi:hypothetical protein
MDVEAVKYVKGDVSEADMKQFLEDWNDGSNYHGLVHYVFSNGGFSRVHKYSDTNPTMIDVDIRGRSSSDGNWGYLHANCMRKHPIQISMPDETFRTPLSDFAKLVGQGSDLDLFVFKARGFDPLGSYKVLEEHDPEMNTSPLELLEDRGFRLNQLLLMDPSIGSVRMGWNEQDKPEIINLLMPESSIYGHNIRRALGLEEDEYESQGFFDDYCGRYYVSQNSNS